MGDGPARPAERRDRLGFHGFFGDDLGLGVCPGLFRLRPGSQVVISCQLLSQRRATSTPVTCVRWEVDPLATRAIVLRSCRRVCAPWPPSATGRRRTDRSRRQELTSTASASAPRGYGASAASEVAFPPAATVLAQTGQLRQGYYSARPDAAAGCEAC